MFPRKNNSIDKWAAVIGVSFMLLFCVIISRFVYIAEGKQVDGHQLVQMQKNQTTSYKTVDAHRGTIYGNNGNVLAHDIPSYTVYAVLSNKVPNHVKDKQKTAQELAPVLHMTESHIFNLLNRNAFQVELGPGGTKVDYDAKLAIDKLHLPGIGYIVESKRYYPNQEFASYVIGFTTRNEKTNKQAGVLGIESSMNKYLTDQNGEVRFKTSRDGTILSKQTSVKKPKQGDNVYLTLDTKTQTVVDAALNKVNKTYHPKRAMVIVENPKTGQIMAMANRPSFNPNTKNITNYRNYAVSDPYEPGSVMKMFTLAGAINAGVYNGNATFKSGSYNVGGITIHDWNTGWGRITFNDGLERSSNVGFSIIANEQLGTDRLYKYLDRFGFTKKTGIDLPGESNSEMSFNRKANQVSTAFGQGSAFTAIQMVQAASAIANNGTMMKPYIIKKVVDPNTGKVVVQHHPTVAGHPITKATAQKTRQLLRTVVNGKDGTGTAYNLPGYNVIGKTGTAQISINGKGYLTGRDNYIFSFMGMAPEKDPKLIVYVVLDRPHLKPNELESGPLKQIFNPVMSNALQYLKVKPADPSLASAGDKNAVSLSNYKGQSIDKVAASLKNKGLNVTVLGDQGNVTAQAPYEGTTVIKGSNVILKGSGKEIMPDITGWSMSDVLLLSNVLNTKPNIIGSGFVVSQKPAKGTVIKSDSSLITNLQESGSSAGSSAKKSKSID